jgi:hypothetical protein
VARVSVETEGLPAPITVTWWPRSFNASVSQ